MGGAVRVGDTVRRPPGPWTPTVQRFLRHLHGQGVTWVPTPLGTDEEGRDVLSHLPGEVPQYPLPAYVWDEDVLVTAAGFLAQLHRAGADFDSSGAVWQLPVHEPAEVVCHNDAAPYNMVFRDERLTGLVDWDTASPGPRAWDLAYLAYRLVPLTDPANPDVPATSTAERARRLRVLCEAYGSPVRVDDVVATAVRRLDDLAAFTAARHAAGQDELAGHADLYRRDARWIAAHVAEFTAGAPRTD
ncbi:phosphotransferase [Kineococcus sp. R8]|nr:aminoglycoside phosphotransferase family protein [Kineococcus siccus]NAZ82618.1 phosphotransferase [Kineococcus siccus]